MLRNALQICTALLLVCSAPVFSQNFKVQVAAFDRPAEPDYFKGRGIEQVYEGIDQLGIFHYFVGAYKTLEEAEHVEMQLKLKGFNPVIFDQAAQQVLCGTPCPFFEDNRIYFDENEQLLLIKNVHFDYAKSAIDKTGMSEVKEIFAFLKENPSAELKIFGYTDAQGSAKYNVELALRRARSVRNELISMGIHASRMAIKVFGELDPVRPNATNDGKDSPENRKLNRRVVLAVTKPDGEIYSNQNRVGTNYGHSKK